MQGDVYDVLFRRDARATRLACESPLGTAQPHQAHASARRALCNRGGGKEEMHTIASRSLNADE